MAVFDDRTCAARPLDTLNADERESVVSVYYGGCTSREAATSLGVTPRTVMRSLRDGLRKLRLANGALVSAPSLELDAPLRSSTAPDDGLAEALDARAVVAEAQGVIMEREGTSATAAYAALLHLSDQRGMTLPACAETIVSAAQRAGTR
jgi:AmiR/NasT family two-component response regulator